MQDFEITKVKKGFGYARSGYIIKGVIGRRIYDTYDEAYAAAEAMPEPKRSQPQAAPSSEPAPQLDRQATRVARLADLPAPKPTGRCHYCGLPLTNGYCEECI